jgi:propionyl-CoA carboxylase alpha chain
MLAKLISWAPDRAAAVRRLTAGLAATRICGPPTNRDLLVSVLRNEEFAAGRADTSLLDGYDLRSVGPDDQARRLSALAAAAAAAAANRRSARAAATIPGGWRNVVSQPHLVSFTSRHGRIDVRYHWRRTGIEAAGVTAADLDTHAASGDAVRTAKVITFAPDRVRIDVGGVCVTFDITTAGEEIWVDSPFGSVSLGQVERLPAPAKNADPGSLLAPMPGSVIRVDAVVGERLTAGQLVLVLEAMKMEHQISAPAAGVLAELRVGRGSQVNAGDLLAVVTAEPETSAEAI